MNSRPEYRTQAKPNPKLRRDERKRDMRRGASWASGRMTAKPSICGCDALCNSGVHAVTVTCLTPGDLSRALGFRVRKKLAECGVICSDREKVGCKRRSRCWCEPILKARTVPERGVKERRNHLPRSDGIASGESMRHKPGGWDETDVDAAERHAPIGTHKRYAMRLDSICRAAVYVTRMPGGVGGGEL